MCIELKDWVLFIAGIIVGFFFSIAVYWMPLGQFKNECKALWNLKKKKYLREEIVIVKPGTDLKPINSNEKTLTSFSKFNVQVANDEGVGWHHTSSWMRARILHAYKANTGEIEPQYKICHLF